jgi:hypothetical protein
MAQERKGEFQRIVRTEHRPAVQFADCAYHTLHSCAPCTTSDEMNTSYLVQIGASDFIAGSKKKKPLFTSELGCWDSNPVLP